MGQRHRVCSECSKGSSVDGRGGNAGEEAGKALGVLCAFRILPVGSGAPLLVKPVLQSSGAQILDPGFRWSLPGDQCRCYLGHALSSPAPGGL